MYVKFSIIIYKDFSHNFILSIQNKTEVQLYGGYAFQRGTAMSDAEIKKAEHFLTIQNKTEI